MTDEEIIAGYVKHVDRLPDLTEPRSPEELHTVIAALDAASNDDDHFWAWEEVESLIERDPERAWKVLLAALARCSPHHEYIIGAGPLEELLVKHPRLFAERVANELMTNPRFQEAFTVARFSTDYVTNEEAKDFNRVLRHRGVSEELIPTW